MSPLPDIFLGLNLPEDVIQDVMQMLETDATNLQAKNIGPIKGANFGPASRGVELGHHSGLAQQIVRDAINDMVTGLRGYSSNIEEFRNDVATTDEEAEVQFARLAQVAECTTSDNAAESQCTVPETGDQP